MVQSIPLDLNTEEGLLGDAGPIKQWRERPQQCSGWTWQPTSLARGEAGTWDPGASSYWPGGDQLEGKVRLAKEKIPWRRESQTGQTLCELCRGVELRLETGPMDWRQSEAKQDAEDLEAFTREVKLMATVKGKGCLDQ